MPRDPRAPVPLPFTPYALVPLTKGYAALVDADAIPAGTWAAQTATRGRVYATNKTGACGKRYMHRVIIDAPPGTDVDHIAGATLAGASWVLDNRRENLRVVDRSANNANAKVVRIDNTTGYRGVWRDRYRLYHAEVAFRGARWRSSGFDTAEAAAAERDRMAEALHGKYAVTTLVR